MDSLIAGLHKFLTSPLLKAWLNEQLIHFKSYEARIRELKGVVENLKNVRDQIQHKVDEEELRHGREIPVEEKNWIERVEELISEYVDFIKDPDHKLALFDLWESGYLPKPGIRYRQSRKAYDITRKANGLLQRANFDTFSYWSGPPSMAAFFSNVGYESFPSREETMRKIIAELEKPSVRMIGLHGLSGMGKTTLVKEVVKVALEAKKIDVVTMASVTRNPDIRKIQGQIADSLGIILDEESEVARAARIHKRLKNEKEKTLIILDDLWEKVDFNMLGIPYEIHNHTGLKNVKEGKSVHVDSLMNQKEGSPKEPHGASDEFKTEKTRSQYKGCKVLLISESKTVLLTQMGRKENCVFCLEALKEKEAETLFKKMAGMGDYNSKFQKLGAQIANKCNGLPMTIVTTARALKKQSPFVWEDILRKLEWQKLTGAPELSTKLSYDLLEDDELKYTFLLCARMGHDALIMDLIKYCIGLGFLQGIYTVRETRDRVCTLVEKLKESGLLSDSYSRDQFTMQNIIRNAALSIANKEKHLFTVTKGKIDEWPEKLHEYAAISLHHCNFIEGFPRRIKYPGLRVFHVNNNDPHLKVPKNLFKGMKGLKVLILTGIHLSLLESSVSSLIELRMLCLEQCTLEELSIIGMLKKLRILSFSRSDIEKLPVELQKLKKLQIFDLSNCSKLKEIPSGVISNLVCLEELYMRNTLIHWEKEELTRQSKIGLLSELKHLSQLTTLDIQIPEISHLPKTLFFDKLYSYKIVIGDLSALLETDFKIPEMYETSRFLAIRLKDGFDIHSLKGVKMLFEGVQSLLLEELNTVHDLFYRLNLKGFPYLKHLLIVNNFTIQSLIYPKDRQQSQHPEKAFPKLESLHLYNLKKIKNICSCKLSEPSFGKLKVIKINLCGQLKSVFSVSMVNLLTVLETIEVSECYSLTEIVSVEESQSNTQESQLVFPKLLYLKLQSLSLCGKFYPIPSSTEGEREKKLFNEKVDVSKIERMELSSIPITEIWNYHHSNRSSFKNLTHLDVNGCWKLKHLISFSMAKCLGSLQSLFVSECGKMKGIFPDSMQMEGGIFPKLKSIKLSSMKSLRKIWPSDLPSKSFSKLDTLIIEKCDKLVSVFPHYYEGIFHSLCNLTVTKCMLMRTIFDTYDEMRDVGIVSLQDLRLEILPNLKHVWKLEKGKGGILKLKNLQKIMVQNCYCLENIFPFSVAENLGNLEYLVVSYCLELREIVAKSAAVNTAKLLFKFPKLRSIKFSVLPRLTSFYPGAFQLCCPTLNDLSIEYCDLLEPFHKETVDVQGKCVLFSEEVLNKLKSIQIESWHAKSQNSCMNEGNHRRDSLEKLCLSRLLDTEILYSFLHSNPNLESLSLSNCLFEEIVPLEKNTKIETLGVVPKLKNLKLIDCKLKDLGFEEDIILRRVELLLLKRCPYMTRVVSSSTTLSSLVNLEVDNCDGLENLMSASTAESLGQLNTMKVTKCKNLMEIVGKDAGNVSKVVFKKLKTLELVSLKKLQSFCSSDSCEFEFPSLERLVVSACYNMKKFSDKVTSRSTPILQNVYVVPEKEKKRHCWEGDLNATIHKMFRDKKFFEGMNMMSFSDDRELKQDMVSFSHHPELNQAWVGGEVDPQSIHSWFYSLKVLKLEKCEIQQCAIPSNILPYLKNLNELMVQDCNNVEVVFEMNVTEGTGTTVQLQKLTLTRLPKLKNVWKRNGEGTHSFPNLQEVSVQECHLMQNLFPAALLQNLLKLHKLIIRSSWGLSEIVGKEDNAASGTQKFKFPCLTTLVLIDLPELIYLYPESFTLKCPLLNILSVLDCPHLDLFPHIDPKTVFSNLQRLALEWKHSLVLESILQDLKDFFEDLNSIYLRFDVDENEKPNLPIQILQRVPNLREMSISSCHYLEAFCTEIPEINKKEMLTDLELLKLMDVWELKSIGSGDVPWLDMICKKLPRLYVDNCPHFMALMHSPSTEVFSCLKQLYVFNCQRLKYLFTSSAAEKLTQLECISLYKCRSIKEIVAKDQGETTSGEFKLQQLCRVSLSDLSSLECFYSGNRTLQVPSLIEVRIIECPKMEIFSQGSIGPNLCREIRTSYISNNGLVIVHDDLNSTLKKVFQQQNHIVFQDSRMLQEIWKSDTLPEGYFHNLTTMVVEGCEFLSDAILPSHLLHLLSNLKRLQVRRCNSLRAVFIHTKITNMGPQGSLTHLEELHVENCGELVAIVAKVEAEIDEANKEITIFSTITLLRLSHLPKLRCIYPEMHMLKWDMLKELHVEHCQKLKFFATEYQNSTYLNPDHQDRVSTAELEVVSLEKVTPCLKVMSLGKEEAVMIEQGKLQIDLPKLSSLKLQCFDDEQGDAFPFIFGSKMSLSLPTIKKLGLLHCAFKEIFPTRAPGMDCTKILSQLKTLELVSLSQLKSIGFEHSWVIPLLQNLKTLLVRDCHCLTNLTPSTVSFSNLIKLNVKHCSKLKYLFTFSTTKTLAVLKEIYITNCKSLKTIVVEDRDGGHLIEDNEVEEEGEREGNEDDDEEEEGQNENEDKEIDDDDDEDEEKMDEAKTNAEGGGDEGENEGGNDAKHGMEKEKEGDGAGEDDKNEAKANAKIEGDGDGNENENDGVNDGNECEDEITFKKLERLTLRSLPKLRSFYSGISTLNFLSLEEVSFSKCCTAKLFCLDDKIPKKLRVKIDDCKRDMNFLKMQQMRQRHHDSC